MSDLHKFLLIAAAVRADFLTDQEAVELVQELTAPIVVNTDRLLANWKLDWRDNKLVNTAGEKNV